MRTGFFFSGASDTTLLEIDFDEFRGKRRVAMNSNPLSRVNIIDNTAHLAFSAALADDYAF